MSKFVRFIIAGWFESGDGVVPGFARGHAAVYNATEDYQVVGVTSKMLSTGLAGLISVVLTFSGLLVRLALPPTRARTV